MTSTLQKYFQWINVTMSIIIILMLCFLHSIYNDNHDSNKNYFYLNFENIVLSMKIIKIFDYLRNFFRNSYAPMAIE